MPGFNSAISAIGRGAASILGRRPYLSPGSTPAPQSPGGVGETPPWEDDFVMDRPSRGWTGQGPLYDNDPQDFQSQATIATIPSSSPAPAPAPAPSPAPAMPAPEWGARPYDRLSKTLRDPQLNPRPKSTGRQILGNFVSAFSGGIADPLAEKLVYGGDQRTRRQLQERVPLQEMDTTFGQRQQQLDDTSEYRNWMWQDRADRLAFQEKAQADADLNRKIQLYQTAAAAADRAGARPIPTDQTIPESVSGMPLNIPGRMMMPPGSRTMSLPPRPSYNAAGDITYTQDPELYIPPRSVLQREESLAKGGKLDPMTIAILGEAKRRAVPGSEAIPDDLNTDQEYTVEQLKIFREMAGRAQSALQMHYNQQTRPLVTSPDQSITIPSPPGSALPPRTVYTNRNPRTAAPRAPGSGPQMTPAQQRAGKVNMIAGQILRNHPTATYEDLVRLAKTDPSTIGYEAEVLEAIKSQRPPASVMAAQEVSKAAKDLGLAFADDEPDAGAAPAPASTTPASATPVAPAAPASPAAPDPELAVARRYLASQPEGATATAPSGAVYIKRGGKVMRKQ